MIRRVAVVELGVNNGSGDGGGCFGIEVWTDTTKLTDERRVIKMSWSIVSKSAERSSRQRHDIFCDPIALMR